MSWRIRVQADDFFNAHQILKESNLALIGRLEKLAGKPLVSESAFGAAPAMGVNIVCLAFSTELYLKDLHFTLNGKVPRDHNILKLYKKLPKKLDKIFLSTKP